MRPGGGRVRRSIPVRPRCCLSKGRLQLRSVHSRTPWVSSGSFGCFRSIPVLPGGRRVRRSIPVHPRGRSVRS